MAFIWTGFEEHRDSNILRSSSVIYARITPDTATAMIYLTIKVRG